MTAPLSPRPWPLACAALGLTLALGACGGPKQPAAPATENPYLSGPHPWSDAKPTLQPLTVSGDTPLSALAWSGASSGWGPIERDKSNGEIAAGDGHTLSIGGKTYQKGLGVHAGSEVTYTLDGRCSALSAEVGLDDEIKAQAWYTPEMRAKGYGSAVFKVMGDGKELFNSGVMHSDTPAKPLNVSLGGVKQLKLVVSDAGDNNWWDHADWADARLSCGAGGGQNWSDPATWGGQVPAEGADVTVPAGKTVVLDRDVKLGSLKVDGTLTFAEKDLNLSAKWILVHGKLQVGGETAPFGHKAVITLTGAGGDIDATGMNMGNKVLGVMGGTLELHGQPRLNWTRLAKSVRIGDAQLTLAAAPNWQPGDRIVLASTDYDMRQAETATVKSVSGAVVTLEAPLKNGHYGDLQTLSGQALDERAEVGLLTHNVVVQGDDSSVETSFGGQIMLMMGAQGRLSSVELTHMGQQGFVRRYPIHFHMMGDAPTSYVKNSSLHDLYNRCLTIHGTNKLNIENNVAYNTVGHCYFMEDGAETGNTLTGNLGLLTKRPDKSVQLLPTDSDPATFWITNPANVLRGNVAGGSEGTGFWYALPEHPLGLSAAAGANVWPRLTPLGGFVGNVTHSNGNVGLNVDNGPNSVTGEKEVTRYNPRAQGQPSAASAPATFESLTSYKNRQRGVWLRGTNLTLKDAALADNARGVTFAASNTEMSGGLMVGESANLGQPKSYETKGVGGRSLPMPYSPGFPIRGFEFYDGKVGARGVTFVNFAPNAQRQASALAYNRFTPFSINAQNYAAQAKFVNATPAFFESRSDPGGEKVAGREGSEDSYRAAVFQDLDGSVTGTAGTSVVMNDPFLVDAHCRAKPDWNAQICDNTYTQVHFENFSNTLSELGGLKVTRGDGNQPSFQLWGVPKPGPNHQFYAMTMLGRSYAARFGNGSPAKLRVSIQGRQIDDWVIVSVPFSGTPFVYRDHFRSSTPLKPVASLEALRAGSGGYYISGGAVTMKIQVRANGTKPRQYAEMELCQAELCN